MLRDSVDEYDAYMVIRLLVRRITRIAHCKRPVPCKEAENYLVYALLNTELATVVIEKRGLLSRVLRKYSSDPIVKRYLPLMLRYAREAERRRKTGRRGQRRARPRTRRRKRHTLLLAPLVVIVSALLVLSLAYPGIVAGATSALQEHVRGAVAVLASALSGLASTVEGLLKEAGHSSVGAESGGVGGGSTTMVNPETSSTRSSPSTAEGSGPGETGTTYTKTSSPATSTSSEEQSASIAVLAETERFRAFFNKTHLVFEWREFFPGGLGLEISVELDNGTTVFLAPFTVMHGISADYVYVNKTYALEVFSAKTITSALGQARGVINLVDGNRECNITVEDNKLTIEGCREVIYIPSPFPPEDTIYDAIVNGIDNTTVETLARKIYGGKPPDMATAVWELLEWLESNTEYDYVKAAAPYSDVMTPTEFYEKRSGVCVDYAVFTATVLLGAGAGKAYIITMDTIEGLHASAAIRINNYMIMVDQVIPPMDWDDYVDFVGVKPGKPMRIYTIWLENGAVQVASRPWTPGSLPDSWPEDGISSSFARDVAKQLAAKINVPYRPGQCPAYVDWSWEALRYYTPLFHSQWVSEVVDILAESFKGRVGFIGSASGHGTSIRICYG